VWVWRWKERKNKKLLISFSATLEDTTTSLKLATNQFLSQNWLKCARRLRNAKINKFEGSISLILNSKVKITQMQKLKD
jgi:hypothetical protein